MLFHFSFRLYKLLILLLLFTYSGCVSMSPNQTSTTPSAPTTTNTPVASTQTVAYKPTEDQSSPIVSDTLKYFNNLTQFSASDVKAARQQAERDFNQQGSPDNRLRLALILGFSPTQPAPSQALKLLTEFPASQLRGDRVLQGYVVLLQGQLKQQIEWQRQQADWQRQQTDLQSELQQTKASHTQLENKLEALKNIDAEFSNRPAIEPQPVK